MRRFMYTITDPQGIHARPAGELVKEAKQFKSSMTLIKNEKEADCKRVFSIMSLAVKMTDAVELVIEGEDEEEAAQAMEEFMRKNL